ncbi:prostaglandin reductase 1 [Folsomia candida]|uniref:Prostaglandin reductase 1 n=1 Tax=Folsomia candida TaxID=158441 RepID=A0A226F383_FOLCA|nr:prostaglandin reductase 1 [Folsomia candida]OXA64243.1 Prostaglandin reductase 1 [Folsomia candida]
MNSKKWTVVSKAQGLPKVSDFKIVEEPIPELQDGEILCKAEWLTVDPYMRNRMDSSVGAAMVGEQIAKVIKSKSPDYPEGTVVLGYFGWRDLTVYKVPPKEKQGFGSIYKVPDLKSLPVSYALGSCGMPGNTAYFGLTRLCDPKPGETVVVSAAAGAVGSVVGQISKIKGCTVIGYAGSDDKVEWLKELGFDHAFNYKKEGVDETLKKYAPKGVDCYFDNVGGEFAYNVVKNMNSNGRIALCGAIETYNRDSSQLPMVPFDYGTMIYKQIKMEGFMVVRWWQEWFQGVSQLRDWIIEGKIKVQETRVEGFDQMPLAFINLLQGKNTGKMIVKA